MDVQTVYISEEQYQEMMTALQDLNNTISNIHIVNTHILVGMIFFAAFAFWLVILIKFLYEPIDA